MEKLLVNADGWYGKLVNDNTGEMSSLCPDCKMIDVEVLGYTEEVGLNQPDFAIADLKKFRPIGKIVRSNEFNFKPYPEYRGVKCGDWVKA